MLRLIFMSAVWKWKEFSRGGIGVRFSGWVAKVDLAHDIAEITC